MDSGITIRRAEFNDLDAVYGFVCELEKEKLDLDSFRNCFDKNITNPDYLYKIAICDYKPVGFISFHTQKLLHHCGIVGEIQELFIDTPYRKRGIGKLLVNEILKFSEINELKSIEVTSNKMRQENIKVYEHYGFKLTHNKFTKLN